MKIRDESWKNTCFEPTYEELKQYVQEEAEAEKHAFWAYLWGIETTIKTGWSSIGIAVLSLPMRNWNKDTEGEMNTRFGVLSLPMRNWNSKGKYSFSGKVIVLSLPMRNWNKLLGKNIKLSFIVLSLPMRNWNHTCTTTASSPHIVLSLPMRNWNFIVHHSVTTFTSRFEPTYEELKQTSSWFGSWNAWVLSLPMRNWNATSSTFSNSLFDCFEPTYEELKLLILAIILVMGN